MTKEHLVTARGSVTLEEAEKILMAKKVEKLLLLDENNRLTGLITIKDIDMMRRFPQAAKDRQGRLRVLPRAGLAARGRRRRQGRTRLLGDQAVLRPRRQPAALSPQMEAAWDPEQYLRFADERRQDRHATLVHQPPDDGRLGRIDADGQHVSMRHD